MCRHPARIVTWVVGCQVDGDRVRPSPHDGMLSGHRVSFGEGLSALISKIFSPVAGSRFANFSLNPKAKPITRALSLLKTTRWRGAKRRSRRQKSGNSSRYGSGPRLARFNLLTRTISTFMWSARTRGPSLGTSCFLRHCWSLKESWRVKIETANVRCGCIHHGTNPRVVRLNRPRIGRPRIF